MPLADDMVKLKRCHLAIGTPGRLKQLIQEEHLNPKVNSGPVSHVMLILESKFDPVD